jgi:uncharacterized protein (TIGR02145 family)
MATAAGTATFALNIGGSSCDLNLQVKSCSAKIDNTTTKTFLCYNLGAYNTRASSTAPSWEVNGGYWQWGRAMEAASGPTGPGSGQTNEAAPGSWNSTYTADNSWVDTNPMGNDPMNPSFNNPCPEGFRVPTQAQLQGVMDNNPVTDVSGTIWLAGPANYNQGKNFGANLMLPAAGLRDEDFGALYRRDNDGYYWSTTQSGSFSAFFLNFIVSNVYVFAFDRRVGASIRCIEE